MSSHQLFVNDEYWGKYMQYGEGDVNGGHMRRWPQGSVGMNSPMFITNNEYAAIQMKHGTNNGTYTRSILKKGSSGMALRADECTQRTGAVGTCQNRVFTDLRLQACHPQTRASLMHYGPQN